MKIQKDYHGGCQNIALHVSLTKHMCDVNLRHEFEMKKIIYECEVNRNKKKIKIDVNVTVIEKQNFPCEFNTKSISHCFEEKKKCPRLCRKQTMMGYSFRHVDVWYI